MENEGDKVIENEDMGGNMKINILTMHRVYNYGSFLQAYGLKRILEKRGHSISFIDIKPGIKIGDVLKVDHSDGYAKYINKYLFKRIKFKLRQRKFEQMYDSALKEYLDVGEERIYESLCDATIIGSDEVFNYNPGNPWGISLELFGDVSNSKKIYTYAASCGYSTVEDIADEWRKPIRECLKKIDAISVRDSNTHDFVLSLSERDSIYNLDPVLIYPFLAEIKEAEKRIEFPSQKYMLVYSYRNRIVDQKEIKEITQYARTHKLKIICIGSFQYWADDFIVVDPFEALCYFKYAECIVTDTFHGTIMSVKLHKKVAIIVRDSNRNKLSDLIERLHIHKHEVSSIEHLSEHLDYDDDYKEFDSIIKENIEITDNYFESVGL